jgi:hypothetical protein
MPISPPKIVLRIGSHAEKEYFEKLAKSLDSIMFGGNLLEITPAATSSFLFLLKARRAGRPIPYYLDPMTYCFGPYIDPSRGEIRLDLDSLKSDKLVARGSKKRKRSIKDSYQCLASALGSTFEKAVGDGSKCNAINITSVEGELRDEMCREVLAYQWERVATILSEDELLSEFAHEARPAALFAPYFFVSPSWSESGLNVAADLASRAVRLGYAGPVHTVFCGAAELLDSRDYVERLAVALRSSGVSGVWLWFDGFDEFAASEARLVNFRVLVTALATSVEVYNLHGGYFSLMLAHDGLTGISHGVGYGERKPVAQVIGAAAPTVRYYLPPIRMRIGIPELQLSLQEAGINSERDFFAKVCDCQICRGVLAKGLEQLSAFGEMHKATTSATRESQTPAAAKMCRYHFLLNRLREPSIVATVDGPQRTEHISSVARPWRNCFALRKYIGDGKGYLERWAAALRE